MSVCSYAHVVARTNFCRNVVLRDCGKLRDSISISISYFLATRSSQRNVEAANDVAKILAKSLLRRYFTSP